MTRYALCLIGVVSLLAACDGAPTQPTTSPVDRPSFALDQKHRDHVETVAFSDCGRQNILMTGVFHLMSDLTSDGGVGTTS
jgi:hypothetical protein